MPDVNLDPRWKDCSDDQLVKFCKSGEEGAFSVLLGRYKPLIRAQVGAWNLSPQDKEDFTQEAWIALLSAVTHFDPDRNVSFAAFAQVCVQNRLTSAARRQFAEKKVTKLSLDSSAITDAALVSEDPTQKLLEGEQNASLITDLCKTLSKKEEAVLILFLQGLSYQEIAETLSSSKKSVDNALSRIRSKLRQLIAGHDSI
ncbi:MAG: sigma-70 family RNA polymerase sigma factor [Oscillospiraceae bacterium]|nr:sigma-70 family RNA polymerase sigma factor [Oscillospiraceae bacterium]